METMTAPLATFLYLDWWQWILVVVLIGLVVFYFRVRGKQ
jgi:hypothetical protein